MARRGRRERPVSQQRLDAARSLPMRDESESDRQTKRVHSGDLSRGIWDRIRLGRWAGGSGSPSHTSWLRTAAENDP